jgi:hypothetical protein
MTYEWNNKLVLHYARLERLDKDKHSSLLGPLNCYQENECCEYGSRSLYYKTFYRIVITNLPMDLSTRVQI